MSTSLTLEQMKKFVRDHFEDFVNNRNAAVIRKNMNPDFHDHDGPGGKTTDAAGDEQMMVGMYKAMPDLRLTIEDMIAEGDKVVARLTHTGTHQGAFLDLPPTGKHVSTTSIHIFRFADGQLVEHWASRDDLGLMQQLGVVAEVGKAKAAAR